MEALKSTEAAPADDSDTVNEGVKSVNKTEAMEVKCEEDMKTEKMSVEREEDMQWSEHRTKEIFMDEASVERAVDVYEWRFTIERPRRVVAVAVWAALKSTEAGPSDDLETVNEGEKAVEITEAMRQKAASDEQNEKLWKEEIKFYADRYPYLKEEGANNNEPAAKDESTEEVLTAEVLAWRDSMLKQYGWQARGLWTPRFIRKRADVQ